MIVFRNPKTSEIGELDKVTRLLKHYDNQSDAGKICYEQSTEKSNFLKDNDFLSTSEHFLSFHMCEINFYFFRLINWTGQFHWTYLKRTKYFLWCSIFRLRWYIVTVFILTCINYRDALHSETDQDVNDFFLLKRNLEKRNSPMTYLKSYGFEVGDLMCFLSKYASNLNEILNPYFRKCYK